MVFQLHSEDVRKSSQELGFWPLNQKSRSEMVERKKYRNKYDNNRTQTGQMEFVRMKTNIIITNRDEDILFM